MDLREVASLGVEPTPTIIAAFLVGVLERRGATSRADLVRAVQDEWIRNGGSPLPGASTVSRVKKALSDLLKQGVVENPMYGMYRLADSELGEPSGDGATIAIVQSNPDAGVLEDSQTGVDEEDEDLSQLSAADSEIGQGSQVVYAFYLPTYRRLSEADGAEGWPIKVGMTTTSVSQRMAAHQTALPESPRLGLVIRTDSAGLLEKIIQGVLTLRGRRSEAAGGSEWFITTIDEIRDIYETIL